MTSWPEFAETVIGQPPEGWTLGHAIFHGAHLSWKTNGENQLDRRRHGTANVWAGRGPRRGKITPEQDAQIRALAGKKTRMELAAMFGVTHSTIQYRLYGGSYRPRRERLKSARNPTSA